MAYLVTVKLLLDEASEEAATALAQAAINCITSQELARAGTLVDSTIEDVSAVNESLNDSIANETYSEGEAFANWLLYSQSEADSDSGDNTGYWSNTYGWTSRDLATRFPSTRCETPNSVGNDATWMLEGRK